MPDAAPLDARRRASTGSHSDSVPPMAVLSVPLRASAAAAAGSRAAVEPVKAFPDLENLTQGNQAWYCLDLLEVLCQLAEVGYAKPVRLMLDYPLIHCPQVLLLGVSNINTTYNLLQHEVLSCVFPAMLKDTKQSSLVKYLWHVNR